ncbi:SRPBCC family protein [Ideonella sp. BN130291]|uniref:SRPBCC family protein n=1 Tax=Ideonella sp. BN130291 TaxID=3112940 RepID=UPI002E259764|nr:SRPBCC family protein [Ideonella sp. BN130291]
MLKTLALALALAAALAFLLIVAAARPDTFEVQRSASIQAPPDTVFGLINDLRAFSTWSPYEKKDPAMKKHYSGPVAGRGAAQAWEGNREVGKGRLEITDVAAPSRVTMELHMIEPLEGRNTVVFTLQPHAGATHVTWSMHGPAPYISKLMGMFFDMDSMIGRDFEAGLAELKRVAEAR